MLFYFSYPKFLSLLQFLGKVTQYSQKVFPNILSGLPQRPLWSSLTSSLVLPNVLSGLPQRPLWSSQTSSLVFPNVLIAESLFQGPQAAGPHKVLESSLGYNKILVIIMSSQGLLSFQWVFWS